MSSEFKPALRKGLKWLISQQLDKGGWPNSPGKDASEEVTGHVLNVLAEFKLLGSEPAKKALKWLDDAKDEIEDGTEYRWGDDIMFRDSILWAPTMVCGTAILHYLEHYDRSNAPGLKIEREILERTLIKEIDLMLKTYRITYLLSCWTYLISSKALHLIDGKESNQLKLKLINSVFKKIDRKGEKRGFKVPYVSIWDSEQGESIKETAQVVSALLCFGSRRDLKPINRKVGDLIQQLVLKIAEAKKSKDNDLFYWDYWSSYEEKNGKTDELITRKNQPFFKTRWCLLTLVEALTIQQNHPDFSFAKSNDISSIIEAGVGYLVDLQKDDGSWVVPDNSPPGPSHCSYALLAIYKHLVLNKNIEQEEIADWIEEFYEERQGIVRIKEILQKDPEERYTENYPYVIANAYYRLTKCGERDIEPKYFALRNIYTAFLHFVSNLLKASFLTLDIPDDLRNSASKIDKEILESIKFNSDGKDVGCLHEIVRFLFAISQNNDQQILTDSFLVKFSELFCGSLNERKAMVNCYRNVFTKIEDFKENEHITTNDFLNGLLAYRNDTSWKTGETDFPRAENDIPYLKLAFIELLDRFVSFVSFDLAYCQDIISKNPEQSEYIIRIARGTNFGITKHIDGPNDLMKKGYLYWLKRSKKKQLQQIISLHPFLICRNSENSLRYSIFYLDKIQKRSVKYRPITEGRNTETINKYSGKDQNHLYKSVRILHNELQMRSAEISFKIQLIERLNDIQQKGIDYFCEGDLIAWFKKDTGSGLDWEYVDEDKCLSKLKEIFTILQKTKEVGKNIIMIPGNSFDYEQAKTKFMNMFEDNPVLERFVDSDEEVIYSFARNMNIPRSVGKSILSELKQKN